ncbi:uncharacterized protein LOC129942102 [Eupeodes corollae]|uniref:uncharacterized protein LOC129942102 n=1 Tax=Eupeodes corollae TaxID=290404 RepID=UPI002492F0B4|nr:uncharacterized protein LOC129942102 [Eupeodes corollae]
MVSDFGNELFNCKSCTNVDNVEMVQCDTCNDWHHFSCVGVTADIEDKEWNCAKCKPPNPENTSNDEPPLEPLHDSNDKPPLGPLHDHNTPAFGANDQGNTASSSKPSTQVRKSSLLKERALILEQLEEERRMKEQRDKEYIDKKYAMLRQLELETSDSDAGENQLDDQHEKAPITIRVRGSTPVSRNAEGYSSMKKPSNQSTRKPIKEVTHDNNNPTLSTQTASHSKATFGRASSAPQTIFAPAHAYSSPTHTTNPYQSCGLSMHSSNLCKQPVLNASSCSNNIATQAVNTSVSFNNASSPNAPASNYFMPAVSAEDFIPSKAQMAARQVIVKEQVTFSGHPEDWPLFISWYTSTTLSCGYTNSDNHRRLQSCLKGEALENVKYRLFIPDQVPGVINTLTRLYGRSEVIIDNLIDKMRNEPPPREDKLQSIIKFSLTIENICGVMMATGLHKHLADPSLLRELVDKLPPNLRLDWGHFSRSVNDVDLSVYNSWLADKAYSASMVTPLNSKISSRTGRNSARAALNVHQSTPSSMERKCPVCQQKCRTVELCEEFAKMSLRDKWDIIKRFTICRTCLRTHGRNRCYLEKACGLNGCTYKHHKMLHNAANDRQAETASNQQMNCFQTSNKTSVLFKIIPVVLHNKDKKIDTFAFLDDGSSISLIDESLASELNVEGDLQPLCLKWTSNTHRTEDSSRKVRVEISAPTIDKRHSIHLRTVNHLDLPEQSINIAELSKEYPYLNGLPVNTYSEAKPRLLIGLDQWKLCVPLRSKEGREGQPIASKTRLGWIIYGPLTRKSKPVDQRQSFSNFHMCECQISEDKNLNALFKEFIALDAIGPNSPKAIRSCDDEKALAILENSLSRKGKRFVVPLLWKFANKEMPDSRLMAERRLICLEKKMLKDMELSKKLDFQIEDYVKKQYARKLTIAELQAHVSPVWYLPVFPVINPNKPGKVRMVWDAAARVGNISLNSMLFSGPDIVPSLFSVLFRFRERKIAICADIQEMFHQVWIKATDQHAQRFLWRNKLTMEIEEYAMQVMTFGSTCSPFCAQFVKNTNANNFKSKYPRASQAIIERHYVDDYLDSVDSEEEAVQLVKDVIFVHSEAGFNIRNFMSNSSQVIETVKERAATYSKAESGRQIILGPEKVLGMWWSPCSDSFSFALSTPYLKSNSLSENIWPTKREMLRILMSVFDPLGLIANFMILLKILLQEVWSSAVEWDEKIKPQHYEKWCAWKNRIPSIKEIVIGRPYLAKISFKENYSLQLHIFVDASEMAYSAVGYFRVTNNEAIECTLVGAKTKVAPLKMISIPRLELEAAVLGTKLARMITEGHSVEITEKYFWSDSRTVLSWINSDHRKYKQFVAFRVGGILEETKARNWRWLSSKENVADEATKWNLKNEFHSNSRWYQGPRFLYEPKEQWPGEAIKLEETAEEMRHFNLHHIEKTDFAIDLTRFSTWNKLMRTMAQATRFIRQRMLKTEKVSTMIRSTHMEDAENYLIRMCQSDKFSEEIAILKRVKTEERTLCKSSPLYKLSPYLDDNGLLRIKGRIDTVPGVPLCTKRPIILPRQHIVTYLIVGDYHQRFCHKNNETVVNEVRQKFYIPKLRIVLKSVVKECQHCKNNRCNPEPPLMGDLPSARLQPFTRPFSFVGIDYFGPLFVKVGRHSEKRWGVLITCLTIRAVHIEVAFSLSADSCIMAIKRFISRRGWPLEIFSDNGTNFRGASVELKEAVNKIEVDKLASEFVRPNLKWNFNPPLAPHMGGSWERLVRSVKVTLGHITPTRNPTDELLGAMMTEVERIINTRPLTYVPLGCDEDEALTPNHFLLGSSNGDKLAGEVEDDVTLLRKNWLSSEQFANRFWRRWVNEYLPDLTRRTKWFSTSKPINVGDIVIIADSTLPRNTWPKGLILQTNVGKDGIARSAVVKTQHGIYTRPTSKLAVLDVGRFGEDGKLVPGTSLPGGSVAKPGSTNFD